MQRNHFLLLKKIKNTESAQLCPDLLMQRVKLLGPYAEDAALLRVVLVLHVPPQVTADPDDLCPPEKFLEATHGIENLVLKIGWSCCS